MKKGGLKAVVMAVLMSVTLLTPSVKVQAATTLYENQTPPKPVQMRP